MEPMTGAFCLVLHTHLPWVAHAGAWPVGEEWLHQAFTHSWRRVVEVVEDLAAEGHRDVLTLGVTPVVAAMLDDPYCLAEIHTWTANWRLRAEELAGRREPHLRALARHEFRAASDCLADIEARWLRGGSSVLRPLLDAGVIELFGGPATHPFQPLLHPRIRDFALRTGLDDARLRYGRAPAGIWAPECGYSPGLEAAYAGAGVSRFVVDGPALHGDTGLARPVLGADGDSGVLAFGRDLDVAYRVWSPRAGYPGHSDYRDFHTFDHPSGFRPARVTGQQVPPDRKRPWQPAAAAAQVAADADDFVAVVLRRLGELADRLGRPGLVVAAYDTELFGHWWYEGPQWLAAVLRKLPAAGVRVTTPGAAAAAGYVGAPVELPASSWGSGKDWRVWDNEAVEDLRADAEAIQRRLLTLVDGATLRADPWSLVARDPVLDQLAREALLALASDWAFMVTKDSAAGYARERAAGHARRFGALADAFESGDRAGGLALAARLGEVDGPFGHLDGRLV
jgi:1,4-alpha-glucan branching enzyme